MSTYPGLEIDSDEQLSYYKSIRSQVMEMTTDTILYTNQQYRDGKKMLVEGANATMLDIDFGTVPTPLFQPKYWKCLNWFGCQST